MCNLCMEKMKNILQAIGTSVLQVIVNEQNRLPSYTVYSCPSYGRYPGKIDVVVVGKDPYEKDYKEDRRVPWKS